MEIYEVRRKNLDNIEVLESKIIETLKAIDNNEDVRNYNYQNLTKYELFIKQNVYKMTKLSKLTNISIKDGIIQTNYADNILLGKKSIVSDNISKSNVDSTKTEVVAPEIK